MPTGPRAERVSGALGLIEGLLEQAQAPFEPPLHGHRADVQLFGGAPVTPSKEHHLPNHNLQLGFEMAQQDQGLLSIGSWTGVAVVRWFDADPILQGGIQGEGPAQIGRAHV